MKKNQEALQLWIQAMNEAANNGASVETIGLMIGYAYQASTGIIKIGAPFKYTQDLKSFKVGNKAQGRSKNLEKNYFKYISGQTGGVSKLSMRLAALENDGFTWWFEIDFRVTDLFVFACNLITKIAAWN